MDRFTAMETFISVIETGSFSGGARRMKVGQPAVSKTIAQLESKLGVRLFVRTTRGLTPTEAGQRFYERAKSAIEAADDAELQARGEGAGLSGMLRVCAGVTFARLHIVPAIPAFLAQHPGLRLDVVLDDRKVDLLEEGIDVALRMGGVREPGAMTARKIAENPRLVLGTPTYFAAAGVPATPADLRTHERHLRSTRRGNGLGVQAWQRSSGRHGERQTAHQCSRGCACRCPRSCRFRDRIRMDVRTRVEERIHPGSTDGVDAAADRAMGSVPRWPTGEREGSNVRDVRRRDASRRRNTNAEKDPATRRHEILILSLLAASFLAGMTTIAASRLHHTLHS
jgi:DNA-binding transcriptional LysR family regulator